MRAMNILLLDKAKPSELILCTYTDKAASEMRNRFTTVARQVGYQEDLSQLRVGTIHGICNSLIMEYRHLKIRVYIAFVAQLYATFSNLSRRFLVARNCI